MSYLYGIIKEITGGYMSVLPRSFYARPTVQVAQDLLGCFLVHEINGKQLIGKIVETEAYCGSIDPASHAYKKTPRSAPMYGSVGHAYIYFIYGNHYCFNVVARSKNEIAGGVLVRAVEPIVGIEIMKKNRNFLPSARPECFAKAKCIKGISNGPGKLTQAFGISKDCNQIDLTKKEKLYIIKKERSEPIITTKRIGIKKATDKLWRFCIEKNEWASK